MKWPYVILVCMCFYSKMATAGGESKAKGSSLLMVLQEAEKNSPRLKSKRYLEAAATENIGIKKSKYYPEISVAAVASTGDPGSFSMLDVDSNLSSSQRVGFGASLILKQDIWDFGRTSNAVRSAELANQLNKKEGVFLNSQIAREVLATYLDCAFLQTQLQNSKFIVDQAKSLDAETDRFVRSGQKSIIERYLVDTEEKSAETRVAEFTERLRTTEERLGILMSRPAGEKVSCEGLEQVQRDINWMENVVAKNPLIDIQEIHSQIAESKLAEAKSESRPKIFGMALAGSFDNDHLKDRNHYAAGIGISLPLFSGFLVDSEIGKQEAELMAEQSSVEATQQSVSAANSSYDERIRSLQVRLQFLDTERTHAKKVFNLANKRYEDLQGSMNDLRESTKNVNRIVLEADQALRDLLFAQGEKSLFNGFVVVPN